MSDNKFILQLKGAQTPKSVVEIKNDKLVEPFTGVPHSTDVVGSIIDDKDSSVVVAKGAQNWKLDGSSLVVASSLSGDGADYTGEFNVSGSGLWINATYSLPATIFSAGTKWALRLCGKNLLTTSGGTIDFTLVVKIGNTHITSKTFTVAEGANVFCRQLVIDFSESEQAIIKAQSGDSLTVQLLCSDTNASATIYNGMTVFTALQRRVDGDAVASDIYTFDELAQNLETHISDKNNPHEVTKAQVGLGNCDNTSDLDKPISTATQTALDGKVNKTGDTLTGMYKHEYGSRTRYMAANSTTKYADVLMNDDAFELYYHYSNSIHASLYARSYTGYMSLYPGEDNLATLGLGGRRWGRIYVTKLCPDTTNVLTLPNETGVLATKGDVDLAANSGRMITDQGVWYAKMYAATVAPSAEDGTNYADFSQVDGQGNPIIVTYNRINGAWVQDQTITPPAEYDGYVPITSKIWDIVEQAGQQGGRILWNHQSKEFTPYPQIVSFEDIEVTGESTVIMPQNPGTNQIVNKNYVDEAIAAIPTPTVDIAQSIDADIVGTLTVADNGDVSGLDYSNYLVYPGTLDMSSASSFEMVFAFTTANAVSTAYILNGVGMGYGSEHDIAITINSSEKLYFYVNASSDTITGTTTIQPNTKYYVKVVYDGTDYILSLSEDGNNWNTEGSVLATEKPGPLAKRKYAIGRSVASVFSVMHMKECYIKENGILVWQGLGAPGLHQRVSKAEVVGLMSPDYTSGVAQTLTQGGTLTFNENCYLYVWVSNGGAIILRHTANSGPNLAQINQPGGYEASCWVFIPAGTVVYVRSFSGNAGVTKYSLLS